MAANKNPGSKTVPHIKNLIHYAHFYALFILGAAVFDLAGCSTDKDELLDSPAAGVLFSLDLSDVIPEPAAGQTPAESFAYKGEYSVGAVDWKGALSPDGKFISGAVYTAELTLGAAANRSFEGLEAGTWTKKTPPEPSMTNFYHFGASTVTQTNPSLDGKTIDITITFLPAHAQSVTSVRSGIVISMDLSAVIPAPVPGEAPSEAIAYEGDYSVGAVDWKGALSPEGNFVSGVVYRAEFTLNAAANRSFEGLETGTWTAETPPAASTTNFYHFGASTVTQSDPSLDGKTIDISITFLPAHAQSARPEGDGVVTAINADATLLAFTLSSTNTGTWKVYDAETGSDVSASVSASFAAPKLTLTSISGDAISPKAYYVSVTEDGKDESGRLALWRAPADGGSAMSLAARFGIPDTALPTGNDGADGVSAVFNVLHAFIADVGAGGTDNTVPKIVLGDWIDLQSLTVDNYIRSDNNTIASVINASNTDTPNGKLLRLLVVGNNSFHSRGDYNLNNAYTTNPNLTDSNQNSMAYNDATPHLVFQFQNIPGMAKMTTGNEGGGYKGSGMRSYLVPTNGTSWGDDGDSGSGAFLVGLVNAGVPDAVLFAPKRYVTNNGKRYNSGDEMDLATGADEIEDKVWLPTVREMFGIPDASNVDYETELNQARLEYYPPDNTDEAKAKRIKYNEGGGANSYWEASPGWTSNSVPNGSFCVVKDDGNVNYLWPDRDEGVAPAFCIK